MKIKQLVLFLAVLCAGVGDVLAARYRLYSFIDDKVGYYVRIGIVDLDVPIIFIYDSIPLIGVREDLNVDFSDWEPDDFLDSDGDGVPDGYVDPDDIDTDGDGVSDKDEIANGTDPNESGDNVPVGGGDFLPDKDRDGTPDKYDPQPDVPNDDYDRHEMVDSDGDGYTNGQETAFGSSPFNPNSTPRNPDMDPPDPDPEEPPPDPDGDNDGAQDFAETDEADYFNNKFNLIREELTTSRNVTKNWLTVLHDDAGDLKNALSAIEDSIREGNAGEGGSGDEDKDINVTVDNSDVVGALTGNFSSGGAGLGEKSSDGMVSDYDSTDEGLGLIKGKSTDKGEKQSTIVAKIKEKLSAFLSIKAPEIGKRYIFTLKIPAIGSLTFKPLVIDLKKYPIVEFLRSAELMFIGIFMALTTLKILKWAV